MICKRVLGFSNSLFSKKYFFTQNRMTIMKSLLDEVFSTQEASTMPCNCSKCRESAAAESELWNPSVQLQRARTMKKMNLSQSFQKRKMSAPTTTPMSSALQAALAFIQNLPSQLAQILSNGMALLPVLSAFVRGE